MMTKYRGAPALLSLSLATSLVMLGGSATAANFNDRDQLVETLVEDEQQPLADAQDVLALAEEELQAALADLAEAEALRDGAQESLDMAEADLAEALAAETAAADAVTAAQMALTPLEEAAALTQSALDTVAAQLSAAEAELAAAVEAGTATPEELQALQTAVDGAAAAVTLAQANDMTADEALAAGQEVLAGAETSLATATEGVGNAEGEVATATDTLANAEAEVTVRGEEVVAKQDLRDMGQQLVDAIIEEIDTTGELVGQLSDRQAFSINRALHSAVVRGFLPLDIDTDKLLVILENDYSSPQIQQLMMAFVHQAKFENLADNMEAKGKTAQAERLRVKATEQFDRATARAELVGGGAGQNKRATTAHGSAKASPQIQSLFSKAFVHEAQFANLADNMEANGKTEQAERFRAKATEQFDRATARAERVGGGVGQNEAATAAREAAKQVARNAAKDVAAETAAETVREAAMDAATTAASSVAQEAAIELASNTSGSEIAAERRGGARGASKSGANR